jgi:hypothetical protein
MDREKSLIRSKRSAITVAELLAKEGLTILVPGGGLVYDITKSLVQHSRSYFMDRTENRLSEFHKALFNESQDEKIVKDFINKEFDLDDYHAILSSCIQDIENEKVSIYVNLMKGLIEQNIELDFKRHFITSCKDLTFTELCFLKEAYIKSNFDLMTPGGINQQLSVLFKTKGLFQNITIDKLIKFGYIDKEGSKITSISEQFIKIIFDKESLLPKSIGRVEYSGVNILIVSYQLGDSIHNKVASDIQESLWSHQIKSAIHILDDNFIRGMYRYNAAVLIVDEEEIGGKYIESLMKFSDKKPLLKINISNGGKLNYVGGIRFHDELNLDCLERVEISKVISEYISTIRD